MIFIIYEVLDLKKHQLRSFGLFLRLRYPVWTCKKTVLTNTVNYNVRHSKK